MANVCQITFEFVQLGFIFKLDLIYFLWEKDAKFNKRNQLK